MSYIVRAVGITSVSIAIAAALSAGCARQQAASSARASLRVGAPITVTAPVAVAALSSAPDKFVGQVVRIEGTVKSVCQGMGCWAEVEGPDGSTFMAKSLDDSVLLPKDCAGRRIVVQGKITTLGPAGDAAAHAEEHHGEEIEGHVCPRPDYVLATEGIELQ